MHGIAVLLGVLVGWVLGGLVAGIALGDFLDAEFDDFECGEHLEGGLDVGFGRICMNDGGFESEGWEDRCLRRSMARIERWQSDVQCNV